MSAFIPLLTTILPVLYGLAVAGYVRIYVAEPGPDEESFGSHWAPILLRTAVFVHLLYLTSRGIVEGHLPLASVYDFLSATGLSLAAVYLYLEMRQGIRTTGIFVLPLVLMIQIVSSAYGPTAPTMTPQLQPVWFELHTLTAVLGYGAFAVSAIYGILFLLLYHDIKANRMTFFFRRMPPLETLGRMNVTAAGAGLLLLGLAIVMGVGWARLAGVSLLSDPKTWLTVSAWLVLGFAVLAYYRLGWRGPRAVYASLAGFATDLFLQSFHTFR